MASGVTTVILPENPDEVYNRLKLILQEKDKLVIILTYLTMKSLLWLINYWNTNVCLRKNINNF